MDIERAKQFIKGLGKGIEAHEANPEHLHDETMKERMRNAIANKNMVIEALEKQIPKKLIINNYSYLCPICDTSYAHKREYPTGYKNYCGKCGQKLDWGIE